MRIALLLPLVLLGCDSKYDCEDEGACDLVETRYDLAQRDVRGRQSVVFDAGGARYALVHFEYGAPQDCPAGCFYSHYCSLVSGSEEYPVYFSFNGQGEQLFDPALYCHTNVSTGLAECAMPAYRLPIIADAGFRAWVEHPDDVNDEMRWCRNDLSVRYYTGEIP